MPIYEYECKGCGKVFEIFQKMGDEPLKVCRVCNGDLAKLISNCAFHLKGSGWYVTDYKKPVDQVKGGSGVGAGPGNGKQEEKSETKTETPAETASSAESVTATTAATETKSATTTT